jgi:TonB family protein
MNIKLIRAAAALAIATFPPLLAAPHAGKPRVIVNLNDMRGLTSTPVPSYPKEAVQHDWDGIGVFELHFKSDGTVDTVEVLLSTDHKALDEAAEAALAKWRCQPKALKAGKVTMTFQTDKSESIVAFENEADWKRQGNLTNAPTPYYPYEARRQHWTGSGVFILHFRDDGTVDKVIPIRSTGNPMLDAECRSTFSKWRCLPGAYTVIQLPITFTMQGRH